MTRGLKTLVNSPVWAALLESFFLPPLFAALKERAPSRILEIGCGRGDTTRMLLERFPRATVMATDYDAAQIELAGRRSRDPRLTLMQADATSLPFPDGGFDLVVELNAFHHIADWRRAARECARVLAPGGAFAVMDEDRRLFNPLFLRIDRPESLFTKEEFFAEVRAAGLAPEADVGGRRVFRAVFSK